MEVLRWALLGVAWSTVGSEAGGVEGNSAGTALKSGLSLPEVDPSRFLIDYAYLRRDYPCSPEERRCFDYGRLLFPSDGRCYRVGERGPCAEGQLFHADRAEALSGGGFRGSCTSHCPDALHVRLAATGSCVSLADLHHTVCRAELGLRGALDAFGEAVCACAAPGCAAKEPRPPPRPLRAPYAGRCTAPDVLHPPRAPTHRALLQGLAPACSAAEHACLVQGRVLAGGACHALRTRGPCAPAEWLVLDPLALLGRADPVAEAAPPGSPFRARVQPVCVPRPCAGGWVALASDRRCHRLRELRTVLCAGEALLYDVFGFVACAPAPAAALPPELPARRTANGRCVMDDFAPSHDPPLYVLRPEDDPE